MYYVYFFVSDIVFYGGMCYIGRILVNLVILMGLKMCIFMMRNDIVGCCMVNRYCNGVVVDISC